MDANSYFSPGRDPRHSLRTKKVPPLRIGIGGPVGTGKTTLVEMLCKAMRDRYDIVVITNDIYTKEDQRLLTIAGALSADRILGSGNWRVPAHGNSRRCVNQPRSNRPDAEAIPGCGYRFIESGGDNLAATFSPELSDLTIYVIDVAGGEKIPRKGGPGITRSDLLLINKTDLAPHVGASLEVMAADAQKMRGERPFVMTDLKAQKAWRRSSGSSKSEDCWSRNLPRSPKRLRTLLVCRLTYSGDVNIICETAH